MKIGTKNIRTREFVYMEEEIPEGENIEYLFERIKEKEHEFSDAIVVVSVGGGGIKIPIAEIEEYCKGKGATHVIIKPSKGEIEELGVGEWVYFEDPAEVVENEMESLGLSEAARCIDMLVRDRNIVDSNLKMHVKESIENMMGESEKFEKELVQEGERKSPGNNKEENEYTLGDFS